MKCMLLGSSYWILATGGRGIAMQREGWLEVFPLRYLITMTSMSPPRRITLTSTLCSWFRSSKSMV